MWAVVTGISVLRHRCLRYRCSGGKKWFILFLWWFLLIIAKWQEGKKIAMHKFAVLSCLTERWNQTKSIFISYIEMKLNTDEKPLRLDKDFTLLTITYSQYIHGKNAEKSQPPKNELFPKWTTCCSEIHGNAKIKQCRQCTTNHLGAKNNFRATLQAVNSLSAASTGSFLLSFPP